MSETNRQSVAWPAIGSTVTPKQPTEAYYSNYGGQPTATLMPGETAIVAKTNIPSVWRNRSFLVADFVADGLTRRVALLRGEYRVVKEGMSQ